MSMEYMLEIHTIALTDGLSLRIVVPASHPDLLCLVEIMRCTRCGDKQPVEEQP